MRTLLLFSILLISICINAQSVRDYTVELSVKTTENPASISLNWASDSKAIKYYIYKKDKTQWTWTFVDSTLSGIDSVYKDSTVSLGKAYEYWVSKKTKSWVGNGYIYAGINIPAKDEKGTVLLLIDSNYISSLQNEIAKYKNDLENEGWKIKSFSVLRNAIIQDVKAIIYKEWLTDSLHLKSVVLLGNIPIPYSGDIAPDGHADHEGAWPADVYYTTFDLAWTDNQIDVSVASRNENKNTKGDGKFDQSYIWPALSKISLGRIDLTNMPAFGMNDTLLTKQYLTKNHLYRTGKLKAEKRGLIDDNFGVFGGEAFASSAYRNFSTMFSSKITTSDYRTTLDTASYLFSFGCGAGSYTSCAGIGSTNDFVNDSLLNPFTMLFGSYFLDWGAENNYLRAPLASKGWGLVSMAGGRPYAMFHHAALGEPLGFAAMCGQNAYPTYQTGMYDFGTYIHIDLMGDPTLTLFNAPLVENLKGETNCENSDVLLSWKKNILIDSFRIYKLNVQTKHYDYVLSVADTFYNDISGAGIHNYGVRTIQNERTPSGNFFNIGPIEKIQVISYDSLQSKIYFDSSIHYCKNDSFVFVDSTVHLLVQSRTWEINQQKYTDSILKFPFSKNGNYTVYLTTKTSQNCESIDSFLFKISHFLEADFTISDSIICLNEEFKISPKNTFNVDSISIKTFPFLNEINHLIYEYKATILGKINITLIYQDSFQCKDSMTKSMFVNTLPFDSSSIINYSWKTDSCLLTNELVLNYQLDTNSKTYIWFFGDGDSSINQYIISKIFTKDSNYLIQLKAIDNISGCASSIQKTIKVYPNPTQPIIYVLTTPIIEKKPVIIKSDYNVNLSYHWNSDGKLSTSDSIHKIIFLKDNMGNSIISLIVKNQYGCPSDSAFSILNVLVNGISKIDNSLFKIYPNPTKNFIDITNENLLNGDYYINDVNGKIYKTGIINSFKNQIINLEEMASGIYFIHIDSFQNLSTYKIIIEK